MIIKKKCLICHGQGWTAEPYQVGEYEWEQEQVVCLRCNGSGYIEIEVDEKTGMPK